MANTLLTVDMITREAMRVAHATMGFLKYTNRQYDKEFGKDGGQKIGGNLRVRMPNKYTVRSGLTLTTQDVTEVKVDLPVATVKGVDLNFTSNELALSLDDFSERIIQPAVSVLTSTIEADVFSNLYYEVYNLEGTAGTQLAGPSPLIDAQARLDTYLVPRLGRTMVLDQFASAGYVKGTVNNFNPTGQISEQWTEGMIAQNSQGFKTVSMTQNCPRHTVGVLGGTPTVNGAAQTGASLVTGGWTASVTGILKRGDVFTIAGVFAVHPETKQVTPLLQTFVVTADQSSTAGGAVTIPISPSIIVTGALQNVNASPASGAAITIKTGTSGAINTQNMAFHRDAFAFVTADLPEPKGVHMAKTMVYDNLSMSLVQAFDINTRNFPCRLDILYGYKTLRPEFACRVTS